MFWNHNSASEKKTLAEIAGKPLAECTDREAYNALVEYTLAASKGRGYNEGKKKLYYISAEFLIGKLLSNNLINLGLYDEVKAELAAAGKSLAALEEFEAEPSLGNGGLGRLAACFMDSCATLGLPATGVGLAYHDGLFKQVFTDNKQREMPNPWLNWGVESWLRPTGKHYTVQFGSFSLRSTLYEIDVTGYNAKSGTLSLFDVDSADERIVKDGIDFDKEQIAKNLTLFLYPDDSDDKGRLLRIYQQYFMVSNGAQMLLDECVARGSNLHDLADYAAVQINDTHPTMVIPELIRLLEARGIGEDEAVTIVENVCAYTNHTILAEALETWPRSFLDTVVPQLMPIIEMLDRRVKAKTTEEFVQIIDKDKRVHMANLDIHFTHSTNGVAALHTEILKNTELAPFYKMYPEKFNNKTNGITFRRWLMECNPALAALITDTIGTSWQRDADELQKLMEHKGDEALLKKLVAIKADNKKALAAWLESDQGVKVNTDAVFDVQIKRLHEYKRQQLNLMWCIHTYLAIKAGQKPEVPVVAIFGAKAAPAYIIAKDIIHAILCFAEICNNDPEVSPWLQIVMVENYNVTAAEKLIPAADISEQISLASKEASGTSNMKFMLNGAVTLGTMDGANVEIADLVGQDNIYTFGQTSDEVIAHYKKADYVAKDWYKKDPDIKAALDFIVDKKMLAVGDKENLTRLYNEILGKDWFMALPDFEAYCEAKKHALHDTTAKSQWAEKMLVNIAKAGYFSSDRTIEQYNNDIWHLR
jgi:starch phosphorylase